MPAADKIDMKERILVTRPLFYLQGIRAIGVDTIARDRHQQAHAL